MLPALEWFRTLLYLAAYGFLTALVGFGIGINFGRWRERHHTKWRGM